MEATPGISEQLIISQIWLHPEFVISWFDGNYVASQKVFLLCVFSASPQDSSMFPKIFQKYAYFLQLVPEIFPF